MEFPEQSIVIDRPVEEVFQFVSDPTNDPKWHPPLIEVTRTSPGPNLLGSTFKGRYDPQRRTLATPVRTSGLQELIGEIVEYEPNQRYKLRIRFVDHPKGLFARLLGSEFNLSFRVVPVSGGTQLFRTGEFNPAGIAALFAPLLGPLARRRNLYLLSIIKANLEAPPPTQPA